MLTRLTVMIISQYVQISNLLCILCLPETNIILYENYISFERKKEYNTIASTENVPDMRTFEP